ncbi:hypothetical protein SD70_02595 [Gordoniibacillus kamchatkensis]|uniref:Uncharacterized protein n=1 Tax=Gordoniibacillus kamchatkensis TaxID=1590651 RepID=A0ABR5AM39_9BACL|nr:hypothetical protein [Paenibacillus sp. VKM B-2647]KIL42092.1 hypothetical protein SD70_02595 [Paenibacillus sp. VKM B-2647]
MDIRPADLILVRGEDLIGNTIELITHSPYSHVAGVVKPNELFEAQAFRRAGYQGLDFYAGRVDVFTCDELTDEQRVQIVAEVERYDGRRYSYLLLLWELVRYVFGLALLAPKDWQPVICSTLWVRAYRKAGIDLCPGVRFPSPADMADSPKLRKVGAY